MSYIVILLCCAPNDNMLCHAVLGRSIKGCVRVNVRACVSGLFSKRAIVV